jgi:NAD(P)-dependent dehydrogenase (short-subunit alcohol dehydrogenase family)
MATFKGLLYITQLVVKQMLAQKTGGSIVTITAALAANPIVGVKASVPMITKGGLDTITKHLAIEYAKNGFASMPSLRASSIRRFTKMTRKKRFDHSTRWASFRALRTSWTRSCICLKRARLLAKSSTSMAVLIQAAGS